MRQLLWGAGMLVLLVLAGCGGGTGDLVVEGPPLASAAAVVTATAPPTASVISERTEVVPAPVEVEADESLWDEVSYVVEFGTDGARGAESGTLYEEPTPHRVRQGTLAEEEVVRAAWDVAQAYLSAYQAGDYAALRTLSRAGSSVSSVAAEEMGLVLAGWTLEERGQVQVIHAAGLGWRDHFTAPLPERDFDLEGAPYVEPFGIEVRLPVEIELQAFGRAVIWEGYLLVIWTQEEGWLVEPWGALAAGRSDEVLGDATLLGAALWPRETLVVSDQGPGVDLVQIRLHEREGTNLNGLLTGEQVEGDPSGYGWHWLARVPADTSTLTLDWVSSRSTPETTVTIELER